MISGDYFRVWIRADEVWFVEKFLDRGISWERGRVFLDTLIIIQVAFRVEDGSFRFRGECRKARHPGKLRKEAALAGCY